MNKRTKDILLALANGDFKNQRKLAFFCECSLGAVNASIKALTEASLVDENTFVTPKAMNLLAENSPKRAVLLASQYGVRTGTTPTQTPKALLKIQGEPLIERLIKQLHEVGITEIYVVVGFAKEQFEYLIDKYGVELLVNTEYSKRQTLYSLSLASERLKNSYIVPCDVWCLQNPFRSTECYSWYMVTDKITNDSFVRINRKQELALIKQYDGGNYMAGIAYITKDVADFLSKRLAKMASDRRYYFALWEDALIDSGKFIIESRLIKNEGIRRVDSLEDMLELDSQMAVPVSSVAQILGVNESEIKNISVLKKGAVNCSYTFYCGDDKYVVRVPSYGIEKAAIQLHESAAYNALRQGGFSEETVYINDDTGLKISRYIDGVRGCDPFDEDDVCVCLKKLRQVHEARLRVPHRFDLFENIDYFESLWGGDSSLYTDYEQTKQNVFSLRKYISLHKSEECLTHIDPVPENFLIPLVGGDVHLIDWEYAAMQDPHVDIAMFCLYSLYNREQLDRAIDIYFGGEAPYETRIKIYCYMAVGGLLWSNWCESLHKRGTEFGIYALKQYRYAKEYYRIVKDELKGEL